MTHTLIERVRMAGRTPPHMRHEIANELERLERELKEARSMKTKPEPPAEMTYEDMQLMVCEGINDIDAKKLVKVVRAMFDAKVRWSEAKDRYLVRL